MKINRDWNERKFWTNEVKTLRDFCRVDENNDGDRFVGLKSIIDSNNNHIVMIYFPCGYNLPSNDREIRQDIRHLFGILAEFGKGEDLLLKVKSNVANVSVNFPIKAYLDIIDYFFDNGGVYFTEKETTYRTDTMGKTNWPKTICDEVPTIQNNSFIYLKKKVRDQKPMENKLITEIHKYCTHESFEKLGWLFGTLVPENTHIRVNSELFISIIKKQRLKTFEDKQLKLFDAMLKILEYKNTEADNKKYYFGTDKFEHIWEKMVDRVFGIQENKQEYFPRAFWKPKYLSESSKKKRPLQPDSIMILNDKFYVLDAKYYHYGLTGNSDDLPNSSDINKQITYGEYIDKKKGHEPYNAFIMPFNRKSNIFGINEDMSNVAEAYGVWKSGEDGECGTKKYEKIQGILVDTRFLMYHYSSNSHDKYQEQLAKIIEDGYKENNGVNE
ncbi:LlaJI family restriction endonuclease [Mycoplasma anserisalpingitidis]|uniref:LlaJI family restriction endonuclease n=1 Tax=Mycoplasma anserisalpingitidis TaxID=519450 RepID=A0A5B8JCR3_9MOLU|nr:LlaJI family restriction endonuclease [Mycoplasma anserisalpingitidis]QDY87093.1 LlaJI family restriction endonuclease [Mycoplasma anserisalpingitidis]